MRLCPRATIAMPSSVGRATTQPMGASPSATPRAASVRASRIRLSFCVGVSVNSAMFVLLPSVVIPRPALLEVLELGDNDKRQYAEQRPGTDLLPVDHVPAHV